LLRPATVTGCSVGSFMFQLTFPVPSSYRFAGLTRPRAATFHEAASMPRWRPKRLGHCYAAAYSLSTAATTA
jgi:hypothetical protein